MALLDVSRPAWLFALLASLAGCAPPQAASAPGPEELLTGRLPPAGRTCLVSRSPETLPGVNAVVDSAALHRDIAALWRGQRLGPGYVVVSLAFDQNGWNARRDVIEHDLPPAAVDSLQQLVFARRREVGPGVPWGARLRIDLADAPRFRVGRREVCAPRLLDAPELSPLAGFWGTRERFATRTLASTVWVRVLVDESGGIADAELESGAAGLRSEMSLIHQIRSLVFEPATVDGSPVASWARVPIPLQTQ